ncbi:MAG: hypothetical protein JO022_00555, partial [Acidobacteriaceae bacterium]|nr:hypothetical protein [Acidobacteriaceae bacterium]
MRVAGFYHSLESDWNHGNAHFLRGIASELIARGHKVDIYEPSDAWSRENLIREYGEEPIAAFRARYPHLHSTRYDTASLDLDQVLDGIDVVLVHEWNEPELVRRIGLHHRANGRYLLFFHDTHHRSVTDPDSMSRYDLSGYDGVLAYGEAIREIYLQRGWAGQVWTWHEAADTRVFRPHPEIERDGDVVWVGNWGDDERTAELQEFLFDPIRMLGLSAGVYGVRYPEAALQKLREYGINF